MLGVYYCVNLPLGFLFDFTACEGNNCWKSENVMKYGLRPGNVLHITDRSTNNTDGNGKLSLPSVFILNLGFKQINYFRILSIPSMVQWTVIFSKRTLDGCFY